MDDSDRKSNSSSSTSNKQRPSIPKSVDENGKSYKTKHFMSPTVSATSKFTPKKKILAERNDSLDDQQKTPDLDSKSVHNGEFSTDSGESGGKSRPRFLRYNPNRRREILLRRESDEKEGGSDDAVPGSAVDSVGGPLGQLEGGGIEESDDEFEEEDDGRGWGFAGALMKLGILLVVLVVFTSYIVSMNDATPSPVVGAVIGVRNGYQVVQDHVYGFVNQNLGFKMKSLEKSGEVVVEDEEETGFEGEISGFSNPEMTEIGEIAAAAPVREEDEIFEGVKVSIGNSTAAIEKEEEASIAQELIKDEIFEGVRVSIGNLTDSHKAGDEPGNIKIKGFVKQFESESVLKVVIGLSVALSAAIASVVLILNNRNTANARENSTLLPNPVDPEPCFESLAPKQEEHPDESAANFLISESLKHIEQHSNLSLESRAAPTIELLGEIEVAEMSTSLRSCSIKNSRAIDTEISSHFSSLKEKTTIFSTPPASSYPLDVQTPPSVLISTVDYPSQSNENKPRKNKASERVDQSGGKNVQTTTLRRSSRLRTRVTSP